MVDREINCSLAWPTIGRCELIDKNPRPLLGESGPTVKNGSMLMKTMRMKLPIGKAKAYLPKRENTNNKVHPHQNTIFVAGIQKCREKLGVRSITRSMHLGKLARRLHRKIL
jgi:hypothetical protein